jgi:hypothetical protein
MQLFKSAGEVAYEMGRSLTTVRRIAREVGIVRTCGRYQFRAGDVEKIKERIGGKMQRLKNIVAAYKNWQHWTESELLPSEWQNKVRPHYSHSKDVFFALLDNLAYGTPLMEYAQGDYPGDDIVNIQIG